MHQKELLSDHSERGYSKLQYFFWLLSGCEISILKGCRSDYNRQAGIGFTIFMTTLFAAFSGGYAGFYFTRSIWAALGFGLIWSMLVFSIDRMLVVTLKKDPTQEKQKIWMPLLGRMVLALLIAFIISIPIELLVFRDQIEIQKQFDKQNGIAGIQELIESNNRLGEKKSVMQSDSTDAAQSLNDARNPMTDPTYRDLKVKLVAAYRTFAGANVRYEKVKTKLLQLEQNDDNGLSASNYKSSTEYRAAIDNYNKAKAAKNEKQIELNRRETTYITNKMRDYQASKTRHDSVRRMIGGISLKIDSAGQQMDTLYHNSFIRDFIALENAAYAQQATKGKVPKNVYVNESLLFFLWLIRLLFFTLEILPTIAKIATPVGAYDRAIYAYELDMKEELASRSADHVARQTKIRQIADDERLRQEKARAKIEGKLHDDLLKDLSSAQYDIGRQKIDAFRKANIPDTGNIPVK